MNDNSEAWSALVAAARSGDVTALQAFELEQVVYRGMRERESERAHGSPYFLVESVSTGVALVLGTLAAQQPDSDLGVLARAVLDEVVR